MPPHPGTTLGTACPWLGVPRQDHLQVDGAAAGGIIDMFCNLILTFVLEQNCQPGVWS